jgi:hypothetical protein
MKKRLEQQAHIETALRSYLPEGSSQHIAQWIVDEGIQFVISRPRQSKLGDFRAGTRSSPSRISVNGDLNPYAFLITTVHEFAHHHCHVKFGRKASPHGPEWKQLYVGMLKPFIGMNIFPKHIHRALQYHIVAPSASSCSCPVLNKAIALHDDQNATFLDDLSIGSNFIFRDEAYETLEKRRTRYLCKRLKDGKKYLISGRATVDLNHHV